MATLTTTRTHHGAQHSPIRSTSAHIPSSSSASNKRKRADTVTSLNNFRAGPTLGGLSIEKYLENCKATNTLPVPWMCPSGIVTDPYSFRPRKLLCIDDSDISPDTRELIMNARRRHEDGYAADDEGEDDSEDESENEVENEVENEDEGKDVDDDDEKDENTDSSCTLFESGVHYRGRGELDFGLESIESTEE